jgi:large subunit ribosomal protein L9
MEVILLKDVPRLGRAGELRKVAPGYARNHLIPKGLAVFATEGAVKELEQQQQLEARREKQVETEAQALAEELEGVTVTIYAKTGEKERLYGSVTSGDIAEALEKETGRIIDRRKIELEEPIRQLLENIKCVVCSEEYDEADVAIMGQQDELWMLMVSCHHCQTQGIILAMVKEDQHIQLITDLTPAELEGIQELPAISSEDVLDVYQFLRDFDGDFVGLLKEDSGSS